MLFDKLLSFCNQYSGKRINIAITSSEMPISHLSTLNKIYDNIYVRLNVAQYQYVEKLKEKGIKFFFDYTLPASNFVLLDKLIQMGVSDVYIADDLCYRLEDVSNRCKNSNVQIRLILNRIPSTVPAAGSDIHSPIFTPRHYSQLNEYIDVAEFDCYYEFESDAYNWNMFTVLYKAWFIKHDWYNDLREINLDLEIFYPVRQEMPNFIERKLNCGRQCVYNDRCHKCETVIELAQMMYEDGTYIIKEGNKK